MTKAHALWLDVHGLFLSRALRAFVQQGRNYEWAAHGLCVPWLLFMIAYGATIPNPWRRSLRVVTAIALIPIVLNTAAASWEGHWAEQYVYWYLGDMAVMMAAGFGLVMFGAHRIEAPQRQADAARKLGRYRLKKKLGAGGMGEVYLAEHVLLKQPCAIKLIRPERAGDPSQLRRFEREVQATARLKHWNTVQIYDYGHAADGTFYYVMEYLPGVSLEEAVRRDGPLPAARVVHLLRQVCAALHEAHAAGLIHRDIKPANIIACERGGVPDVAKLLDFGLVQAVGPDGDADRLTQDGAVAGTPAYMSPEQASGRQPLDPRTDIYSLGAVAHDLLTGRPPFPRGSALQVILAHVQDPVIPPRTLWPDIPEDLEAVVMRCLEKDPPERVPDAVSLDRALAKCECAEARTAAEWAAVGVSAGGSRSPEGTSDE
jgi:serine/threonine-protein kinase